MRNAVSAAALGLVAAALLGGGGSGSSRLVWIGGLALLAAAVAYAALGARVGSRAGAAYLAVLAGIVVWDGASVAWSVGPDLSWNATNRALVYLGFACLGVAAAGPARRLAYGLALASGAAVLWALLAKAVPGLYPDYGRIARLRSPVGYWNALAQVGDALLPLGIWLLGRRRAEGLVLRYPAPLAVQAAAALGAVAAVAGVVALAVHAGGPAKLVDEFAGTQHQLSYSASRFGSVNSSNRSAWWAESWTAFTRHPLDGSGAGSFQLEHRLVRTTFSQPAEEPHSLPLQLLGETGIVGLLLLAGLAAAAVAVVRRALRRDERAAVAALAAGCAAYGLHLLVDIHWAY